MRRIILSSILLVIVPLHQSAAAEQGGTVLMFGGGLSYATWLSDYAGPGKSWIWGYWTGRNVEGVRTVGHTTDQNGIVGEVQLVCQSEPSLSLINAVSKVYKRFLDEGR